ncbi:flagellar basal-body MS-ring/collar protein FliF [Paracoccaceae bacterium]|nr:flagellar basal-body MS-ring/collar protein FliF [Paracoccaceae bacterium]
MTELTTNTDYPAAQQGGMLPAIRSSFKQADSFYRQPAFQRALPSIAAAVVAILGLIVYVAVQTPDRTTLFASLSEGEKARVFDALKNNGMDVQIDPATGELTVPVDDYHNAKLNLASQGIPMQAPTGSSALNDMPMGTSRSVEALKIKQSLEYELARSITEIDSITNARVHLAIPERSAFARNTQEPSASVFIELASGRTLSSTQVEAIVNLVSSSVPNLGKSKVSIVDQAGRLLSNSIEDAASTASELQFQYRMRIEDIYRSRVERLLTPIVGPGNVSSQVNIDIDFTTLEVTEDRVLPDNVLLSQQKSVDEQVANRARGIPGSVGNTPPAQSNFDAIGDETDAVGNDADPAGEAAAADADPQADGLNAVPGDANAGNAVANYVIPNAPKKAEAVKEVDPMMRSSSEVQNYEVSRQISTRKMPSAKIQKITVAVLLREQMIVGPDGQSQVQTISADEKQEIQALVTNALGLTPERGDMVIISSRPFMTKIVDGVVIEWYQEPWVRDLMNKSLMLLIIAVVSLGILRPLMTRLLTPSQDALKATFADNNLAELEAMDMQDGQSLEDLKAKLKPKKTAISAEMLDTANSYDDKVALIRMMVGDEAGRVSNVFKAMMEKDMNVI